MNGNAWLAARRQDARWARQYAMPWVRRRLRGTSSGDDLDPKRPDLIPIEADGGFDGAVGAPRSG